MSSDVLPAWGPTADRGPSPLLPTDARADSRGMAAQATTLGDLSRDRCLELLRSVHVGRVVYTVDALPAVTPVRFAVRGPDVLVRAGGHSRLARGAPGAVIAFQADSIDPDDVADEDRAELGAWRSGPDSRYLRIVSTVVSGCAVEAISLDGSVVPSADFP